MIKHCILTLLVLFVLSAALLAEPRSKPPTTWEIQNEVHKAQDSVVQKYERLLKDYENNLLRGLRESNRVKRFIIAPLYQKLFNVDIPNSSPDSDPPADELKNLTDGKLYADTWLKFVTNATLESSDYYNNQLAPVLNDPRTDRGAIQRIQNDARTEWANDLQFAGQKFTNDSAQITNDFQSRLTSIAREHKNLRDALASIVGVVSVDDFDKDFDKYIKIAEAKMQPPAAENPSPAPQPSPAPGTTPQTTAPKSNPAETAAAPVADLEATVESKINDLYSKLKDQKRSLDAIKGQAQSLDDNYPVLHHELSGQIEKLRADIFWLRLILVIVGAGMFVSIGIALLALDRASGPSQKTAAPRDAKRKRDGQMPGEEPMKAIFERIYKLEQELAELRGEVTLDENLTPGEPGHEG